jgi:N utilization substance protein A
VDIRSETEFAAEEAEHGYEEEEVSGRCAAVLSNGRRCPNASLPGSRYCGLETHQALANIASDKVADLSQNGEGGAAAENGAAAAEGEAAPEPAGAATEPEAEVAATEAQADAVAEEAQAQAVAGEGAAESAGGQAP